MKHLIDQLENDVLHYEDVAVKRYEQAKKTLSPASGQYGILKGEAVMAAKYRRLVLSTLQEMRNEQGIK